MRLAEVGQVSGEHQCLRLRVDPAQPLQHRAEPVEGVDDAVLPGVPGQEMGVADVRDDVGGRRELAELDHGPSLGDPSPPTVRPSTSAARPARRPSGVRPGQPIRSTYQPRPWVAAYRRLPESSSVSP